VFILVEFQCGKCGWRLEVPDKYAGKRVRCKKCNQTGVVSTSQSQPQANGPTSLIDDTPEEFIEHNYDVFQALLQHEKEAPTIDIADLR
jgi:hypothetical protein